MSDDVECPYCDKWNEICHDDGFGYDEGRKHEIQCSHFEKYFVFETSIIFNYDGYKSDCLNGKPHKLKNMGNKYWPDHVQCEDCDYEERGRYVD